MPATVVIGGQWGDEGKGRVVDLLARDSSVIARYSAGNNAGHTIINSQGLFALHVVPAGIFYPDKTCLIGNGVAIDPKVLLEEIDSLEARDVSTQNLFVSDRAHVVMPYPARENVTFLNDRCGMSGVAMPHAGGAARLSQPQVAWGNIYLRQEEIADGSGDFLGRRSLNPEVIELGELLRLKVRDDRR